MSVLKASIFFLATLCLLLRYPASVAAQNPLPNNSGYSPTLTTVSFPNSYPVSFPSLPVNSPAFDPTAIQRQGPVAGSPPLVTDVVPDLVQVFASHFIQNIEADPELKGAFAIRRFMNDQKVNNLMFNIAFNAHSSIGLTDADNVARFLSNAVAQNFEKVTTDSFIRILAYGIGKYVFALGLLKPENVLNYSQLYFEKIKEAVSSVVDHTPEADLMAIAKGYFDFLKLYGLFTLNSLDLLDNITVQEWNKL